MRGTLGWALAGLGCSTECPLSPHRKTGGVLAAAFLSARLLRGAWHRWRQVSFGTGATPVWLGTGGAGRQ